MTSRRGSDAKEVTAAKGDDTIRTEKEEMIGTTSQEPVLELDLNLGEPREHGQVECDASSEGAREGVGVGTRELIGLTVSEKGKAPSRSPATKADGSEET